jgi:hypothetical protein
MRPWFLMAAVLAATPAAAQTLDVIGPAGQHAVFTAKEVAAMPHVRVAVNQHGQAHAYEGVPLAEIVAAVGAARGDAVKGPELATVIRVTAADGYQVVLGLAETDPGTRAGRVVIADREAGRPLPAQDGPFRLVVEGDLRPARSARQVEVIEVLPLFEEGPK